MKYRTTLLVLALLMIANMAWAQSSVLLREDFKDLGNWEPLYFPKIAKHTEYTVVSEGKRMVLKTQSSASASALVYKRSFNPYQFPRLRWRWKVENIYKSADGRTKAGDDYPLRIYVIFQYDPEKADLSEKLLYGTLKAVYGKYPPQSTLNYVWASSATADTIITSPYTDRAKLIAREKGPAKIGQWVDETVHIIEDYRKAFGRNPPDKASLAIMNDSDNTGEAAVSYLEFIEVAN
jgi:hypothetical protein